ncbi:o-succinylbenzoate--CoA ligase [Vibrio sinensis]|uniref:O-succinylbenzoate--CoA ligase n=1 Tax=Vibrio sinensis TaxID=2302434 RepID=A0A3A6QN10_9VIBR|nr:o-succinylbenzoate--CoA ligase [Vibrio sinensis]RJX71996.1 o-succinylbenzoate--CoA ligase [Vibrio sinensis]
MNRSKSPLNQWAHLRPFAIALRTPERNFTWEELRDSVNQVALGLLQQGVVSGNIITCVGKNSPELVLMYLACLEIGVTCALTMPQPKQQLLDKLETLYRSDEKTFVWLVSEEQNLSDLANLHFDRTEYQASNLVSHYHAQQLASVIFTSGSTGTPKAVAHTSQQHFASADGLLQQFVYQADDCWLLSLPMYHVSGLAIIYRWLWSGAALKVGTGELSQDVHNVTHASLVATQLSRLLETKQALDLKRVLLGGSHIPLSLAQAATDRGIETWLGYGMTEAASTVTAKRINSLESAGRLLANREIKLVDQRIYIAGETLAKGYLYQGQITPLCDQSGWFDSKDLGQWIEGELQIIGRADNQFISGGENIHCEEIERALNQHTAVIQSLVIPIADERYGARPLALVQSTSDLEDLALAQWLSNRLVRFKVPDVFIAMPSTLLGSGIKLSRHAAKEWLKQSTNYQVI